MAGDTRTALVRIDVGADPELADAMSDALRVELLDARAESVGPAPAVGPAPRGSRGVDPVLVGALTVSFIDTAANLAGLIGAVRDWMRRDRGVREIEVTVGDATLKLTNATPEQQDRLVEEFVRAVATR